MKQIAEALLLWYQKNARVLPWRKKWYLSEDMTQAAYSVWVSEIMLQQTRVEAVREYYMRFFDRLPSLKALSQVSDDILMKLWQGLGYYHRASNLKKAAQLIMDEYDGQFPREYDRIRELPGIGEYTAGAIASIVFHQQVPAIDGNVYRIYSRLYASPLDFSRTASKKEVHDYMQKLIPKENPDEFNQAWMDLGALVCLPHGQPKCEECPLKSFCKAYETGEQLLYPVKHKKPPRRIEEKTVLLVEYHGKYLIQKRMERGLLAGLWEFPNQEGYLPLEELRVQLLKEHAQIDEIELLGAGKHIFSHIEWHMQGYLVHLRKIPDSFKTQCWASYEQLQADYSIPSAFSCYYQQIAIRKKDVFG
jgi:A/G-specific adenine glycosylase